MTISLEVDESRSLTVFTARGELTFEAQITVLKKFYAGSPTPNVLWDMRLIEGNRISADELREIIAFIKQHSDKRTTGKTALVAPSDLDFGLSRVSGAYAEFEDIPWVIRPFRTMGEALAWIDED